MCSRYSLTSPPEAIRDAFGTHNLEPFPPRYNIAPSQPVLIVRRDLRDRRELALVRWGLIPGWSKEPDKFGMMFNARAETACEKPAFRGAMRHRRCLVPTDGYYEWTGPTGQKQPYLVRRPGGGPFAMAALWEDWLGADGSEIETMAILTVPASGAMARLHPRMPVLLEPDAFAAWLDVRDVRAEEAAKLFEPRADPDLEVLEISTRINNSRSEGPDVQQIIGLLRL